MLLDPFESRKKEKKLKNAIFSLLTEGIQNEKIHFWLFFMKIDLFAPQSIFSVKIAKRSEMSRIFLSGESNLHKKTSISFCFHRQRGKTWAVKSFLWQLDEKKERKTPWGAGIILRPRGGKKKKEIPEPSHTLKGTNYSGVLLSGFSLRRNKRKKKKEHFFVSCSRPGLNPRPSKKWQNRLSFFASTLVPSSGTSPGFTGLGGNRVKYIFKVELIFIAKNFLIWEGLW